MKLTKTSAAILLLAGALSLGLAGCKTTSNDDFRRPSNVIRTQPDPTTALSGVAAGSVERTSDNIGAGQ